MLFQGVAQRLGSYVADIHHPDKVALRTDKLGVKVRNLHVRRANTCVLNSGQARRLAYPSHLRRSRSSHVDDSSNSARLTTAAGMQSSPQQQSKGNQVKNNNAVRKVYNNSDIAIQLTTPAALQSS